MSLTKCYDKKENDIKCPILEVRGLTRTFPGVKALDQVDFDLYPGEVHILVGENGAGKSTLSKCLLGVYQPESGKICYKGENVTWNSPREALDHGIAAVYQELSMIPYLNAAENIYFNREPLIKGTGLIHRKKMYRDCRELLRQLNCENMDITIPARALSVAQQQMVEIARALSFHPDVLIFDEPTATLTQRESKALFEQIYRLKKQGAGIIYISHRMEEFHQIGDRITVLRDGKKICTIKNGELSDEELIRLMVGRELKAARRRTLTDKNSDEMFREKQTLLKEMLRVEHLSDKRGRVKNCSMHVGSGEIVGLAGLIGSGRTNLARLIFGMEKPAFGEVYFKGKRVTGFSPSKMVSLGMGLLPEDRKGLGLATEAPISWNVLSASLFKHFPGRILSEQKITRITREYMRELRIAAPDTHKKAGELSGGNQQKVVLAKWLAADAELFIFDEPTRGIDVAAKEEIYHLMESLVKRGKAILMISSDLQEIFSMSDRMYVMAEGSMVSELRKDEYSMEKIGQMMLAGGKNHK